MIEGRNFTIRCGVVRGESRGSLISAKSENAKMRVKYSARLKNFFFLNGSFLLVTTSVRGGGH